MVWIGCGHIGRTLKGGKINLAYKKASKGKNTNTYFIQYVSKTLVN